jgi:hypothetical protein
VHGDQLASPAVGSFPGTAKRTVRPNSRYGSPDYVGDWLPLQQTAKQLAAGMRRLPSRHAEHLSAGGATDAFSC